MFTTLRTCLEHVYNEPYNEYESVLKMIVLEAFLTHDIMEFKVNEGCF